MLTKLTAISTPHVEKVHDLWRERTASQGMKESNDATEAPKPNRTSSDGSAQHKRVLTDVNRER
jgi:hypothetical protein